MFWELYRVYSPQPLGGSEFGLPRSHKIIYLHGYRKSRFVGEKRGTEGRVDTARRHRGFCFGRPKGRPYGLWYGFFHHRGTEGRVGIHKTAAQRGMFWGGWSPLQGLSGTGTQNVADGKGANLE